MVTSGAQVNKDFIPFFREPKVEPIPKTSFSQNFKFSEVVEVKPKKVFYFTNFIISGLFSIYLFAASYPYP